MRNDEESTKDAVRREMMAHIADLEERCAGLRAARDPFSVYNEIPGLRSLVGQIDSASRRYRKMA